MPKAPAGAKWTEAPRIVEQLNYRRDRSGFTDNGYRHVFVVPASGGTPRQITAGNFDHAGTDWTPDGRSILFTGLRSENASYQWRESEIYAVDVADGAIRQLTKRKGPDGNPTVSPDGKRVAYTGYDWTTDTWVDSKIYLMNIDGSNPRLVSSDWDRAPAELRVVRRRQRALLHGAERRLAESVLPASQHAGKGHGGHEGHADADRVRHLAEGPCRRHADHVRAARRHRHLRSQDAGVDQAAHRRQRGHPRGTRSWATSKEIWYTSVDGMKIQGWYITPPDFDPSRKYPMQLHIHGGPHSMYGVGFNYGWQEHAANDYVILYTNPRGSTGYGSAFGNAIKNAYPSKDFDDLMAGVDALLAKGFVDPQNLFVTGCSGGGVLTAWTVGHTDRFAAASANCPVIDWLSFVGTTDGASWYYNFAKLPWEDPTEHIKRSPLTYVGNVKTPTMLMTGVNDLRTPMPQTEQFYSALKLRNVPTAMIRFNDEWHGTTSDAVELRADAALPALLVRQVQARR